MTTHQFQADVAQQRQQQFRKLPGNPPHGSASLPVGPILCSRSSSYQSGRLRTAITGEIPAASAIFSRVSPTTRGTPLRTERLGGAWQFSIDKFVEISFDGKKQLIGRKKPLLMPQLICVFVVAGEKYGEHQFFVIKWSKVQEILIAHHARFLDSHAGVRPKVFDSLHCSLELSELQDYKDNWSIITTKP